VIGSGRRRLALGLGILAGFGVFLIGVAYISVAGDAYLDRCAAAAQQPPSDDRGNWNYAGELSLWPPGTHCTYTRGSSSLELTVPLDALEATTLVGLAAVAGLAVWRLVLPQDERRVVVVPVSSKVIFALLAMGATTLLAFGLLPLLPLAVAAAAGVRLRYSG